ncbi:MAG: cation:proton antiporter, partial [Pseudomonadota bacterium]
WDLRARLLGFGGGQVGWTTLVVALAALAFGMPWQFALTIGLVMALSSTAIVLQTLNEKGLMRSDGGASSFSVLLFQDIAVIPMLALMPLLAVPDLVDGFTFGGEAVSEHGVDHGADHSDDHHGDDHGGDHGGDHGSGMSLVDGLPPALAALVTLGAIAFVILGGSYLTRPVFRFIAAANLRELFTATALMMVVGIALLMSLVGLSPALGTFLAGVVLANSEYRHELESDIDPFKGLLLGLFFMTVGAGINFSELFANFALVVGLTVGLLAAKAGVLWVLGRLFGLRGADQWLFALGLAQAGEFGFVLLSFTTANGVLPTPLADLLLLVVALSMLLTPLLFILYDQVIAPRYAAAAEERAADTIEETSPVIIAGRGRVGGIVERMLKAAGYRPTVIDYSSKQLDMLRLFGIRAYFGDATRPDLLHAAGIGEAKLFVVAIDGKEQITELVRYVRSHYPDVHVMARAVDREHVYQLWYAGCRDIIRETYDSSIRMGRSAFEALGIDTETSTAMADLFNEHDRRVMLEVADVYLPDVPITENADYLQRVRDILGPREQQLEDEMTALRKARAPE